MHALQKQILNFTLTVGGILGRLKVGQDVIAMSDALPDREFPAEVRTIGSRIDATTRAAIVRAHINNEDSALRPGMLLRVRVVIDQHNVVMVPETSLQQRGDRVFVFLVEEGFARIKEIQIGTRQNGWVQVTTGLSEGDPVISRASSRSEITSLFVCLVNRVLHL